MKILISDSQFARDVEENGIQYRCIGLIFKAEQGDMGVIVYLGENKREFWPGEYVEVPKEIENESDEFIKLYLNL